ncbi:uncharacterized protein LOC119401725 [Rhipicephalus sanguineus]|uniref:uncharacterized protein LOC119401725 n=1 Tax=Rhipicephalus sanguineus TaxID=34632 RepID=UPI0020C25A70|nr:uncharacterized protein LOC119401725 [Rhipicephalus sanguineus]
MAKVDLLMDSHIKPCRDFYRHVCRHWIDRPADQPPTSFMIDMASNYTKIWHRKLTQDHIVGDYVPLKQDASHFYRSCLVFHETPIDVGAATEELFNALDLTLTNWFKEKSPENFFRDIIRLSLVNRFHTLVSTTPIVTDSDKTLLIRRESPFHLLVNPIYERHLEQYASGVLRAIGKKYASDAVIDEVLKLDLKRARMVVEDSRTERSLEDAGCQGFPATMWRRALQKVLSAKEQQVDVKIEAADTICEDLNAVLVRTNSSARPLYVLALLAVPVVTYDYELSGDRDPVLVKGVCYHATGVAFEDVWLQLLSSFLDVSNRIEKAVDAYMDLVKLRMNDHLRDRSWMSERDRSAALGRLSKVRLSRFRGAGLTVRAVMCNSDKYSMTANFTTNLVALRSRDIQKCLFYPEFSGNDAHVIKILAGTDLIVDPETLTVYVPVSFTIPPMYHRQVDSDKFVNMALMGVQLARKVMSLLGRKSFNPQAAVDNETTAPNTAKSDGWSPGTLNNYTAIQTCYAGAAASYHRRLDDSQFDDAFAVVDAMRLAYAGKREYDVDVVRRNEKRVTDSNAAFFKLACLSLCTSRDVVPDANTMDFEASYAACLFGVTALPQFAQAFQCHREDRMWSINRCCVD